MTPAQTRRRFLGLLGSSGAVALTGCLGSSAGVADETRALLSNGVLHTSPSCVCCEQYASYVAERDVSLTVRKTRDLASVKSGLGVPRDLWSCHTVETGEYVVEGHVPLAAVERLASERPSVAGIALPGMPAESPGMGGTKRGEFVVYAFDGDGRYHEFTHV